MLELAATTQALAHLRTVGNSAVKIVALVPLILLVLLLAPALAALLFTQRGPVVLQLLGHLERWTSIILNGPSNLSRNTRGRQRTAR